MSSCVVVLSIWGVWFGSRELRASLTRYGKLVVLLLGKRTQADLYSAIPLLGHRRTIDDLGLSCHDRGKATAPEGAWQSAAVESQLGFAGISFSSNERAHSEGSRMPHRRPGLRCDASRYRAKVTYFKQGRVMGESSALASLPEVDHRISPASSGSPVEEWIPSRPCLNGRNPSHRPSQSDEVV